LELEGAELLIGKTTVELGHIPGNAPESSSRFGYRRSPFPANKKKVQWLIRINERDAVAHLMVKSQKAGTASSKIFLQKGGH